MPEPLPNHPVGLPFVELQTVDSTNNYALGRLHAGMASHGTAFFSHEQVAGKGQRGKSWVSEKAANLALSVVFAPGLPVTKQFRLNACVAVAVATVFERFAGDETRIKWPNDLYWQDRKAGGILIENIIGVNSDSDQPVSGWKWAVAGIGINLNQAAFPSHLPNPVSLLQITGKKRDPVEIAFTLCDELEKQWQILKQQGFTTIFDRYQRLLYRLDEPTTFRHEGEVFEARILGVTDDGLLMLENRAPYRSGDLEWLLPARRI